MRGGKTKLTVNSSLSCWLVIAETSVQALHGPSPWVNLGSSLRWAAIQRVSVYSCEGGKGGA